MERRDWCLLIAGNEYQIGKKMGQRPSDHLCPASVILRIYFSLISFSNRPTQTALYILLLFYLLCRVSLPWRELPGGCMGKGCTHAA